MSQNNILLENVINGLECCQECNGYTCRNRCPYHDGNEPENQATCTCHLTHDALALLKAYVEMEKNYSQVLMETTGNLLSKTNYTVPAIMDCIREHYCDRCDVKEERDALLKAQEQSQREYEAAVEMEQYCERYEPTFNSEDGSM